MTEHAMQETDRRDILVPHTILKPLRIKDRPLIDSILLPAATMLSAYSFAAHYVWRDIFQFYWNIIDDHLCLFAQYEDYLYMPLPPIPCHAELVSASLTFETLKPLNSFQGQGDIPAVFSIMNRINKNKAVSRIENIDESQIEAFTSMGYNIKPGEGEYVYLRKDLADLKGNGYKSKRALCNYFEKHYAHSYAPFQADDAGECMRLFGEWRKKREGRIKDPFYHALMEDSSSAHKQALGHSQELHLTGRLVKVNGRAEGYILGFARGDILYILMEVANPDIKGLAQFIFREFCREIDGYTYINVLGDSGLENLRRVKRSYWPCKIVLSYSAYLSG